MLTNRFGPWEGGTLQDLAACNAYETVDPLTVLKQKGLLRQMEVVDEIAQQKKGPPHGR